jgi:hypothetical protein
MPRGDRTGPQGMGPKTGRGLGFCSGFGMPGYANPGPGRGFGGRGGGGRGWRHMYYATGLPGWSRFGPFGAPYQAPDPEAERQMLKTQADALQSELTLIKKRLEEIETGKKEK